MNRSRKAVKRVLPFFALGVGLFGVYWSMRDLPLAQVASEVQGLVFVLPLLIVFEVLMAACDAWAWDLRLKHKDAQLDLLQTRVRAAAWAYALAAAMPAGRVVGEAARAGILASNHGVQRTTEAAFSIHAAYITLVALLSFLFLLFGWFEWPIDPAFQGLLAYCTISNLLIALFFVAAPKLGLLSRAVKMLKLDTLAPSQAPALQIERSRKLDWLLPLALNRALHILQGTTILLVVQTISLPTVAFVEGAQLVAANAGDFVPGNLGILEGTLRAFGPSFAIPASTGIVLAVLLRIARVACALIALCLAFALRERRT